MPSTYSSTTEKMIADPSLIDAAIAAPASEARLAAIRKAWSVARRAVDGKAQPHEIIEAVRDAAITGAIFKTWTDWLRRRDSIEACAKHLGEAEQGLAAALKSQEVANRRADELRAEAAKISGEAAVAVHDARQLVKTRRSTAAQPVGVAPVVTLLRPDAETRERAIRNKLQDLQDSNYVGLFEDLRKTRAEIALINAGKLKPRYISHEGDAVADTLARLEHEAAAFERKIDALRSQRAALEKELRELAELETRLLTEG